MENHNFSRENYQRVQHFTTINKIYLTRHEKMDVGCLWQDTCRVLREILFCCSSHALNKTPQLPKVDKKGQARLLQSLLGFPPNSSGILRHLEAYWVYLGTNPRSFLYLYQVDTIQCSPRATHFLHRPYRLQHHGKKHARTQSSRRVFTVFTQTRLEMTWIKGCFGSHKSKGFCLHNFGHPWTGVVAVDFANLFQQVTVKWFIWFQQSIFIGILQCPRWNMHPPATWPSGTQLQASHNLMNDADNRHLPLLTNQYSLIYFQ